MCASTTHKEHTRGKEGQINSMRQGCKDTTRKHKGDMQALSKYKYRHACIKTRLLLGVAKNKESKTKGKSNMKGMH